MRTIHADLITAQQSVNKNPYIYLSINATNYTSRLISLEHHEEPFQEYAIIVLANSDRHFNSVDLRGKEFTIGYGYVAANGVERYCGDGADSEAMPTLWVKSQSMVSQEGVLVCILECEGAWGKLREYDFVTIETSDRPFLNIAFTSLEPIFTIIEKCLTVAGFTLNALGTQDDGMVNSFKPTFTANPLVYETSAYIINRLLTKTKGYLRQVESKAFEFIYPQTTDTVQESYYSYQAPYFKEYVEKLCLIVPNTIQVYANLFKYIDAYNAGIEGDELAATLSGLIISTPAVDTASVVAYGTVIGHHLEPYVIDPTEANHIAEAILVKLQSGSLAGRLVLPFHDCRVELFDKISILDSRGL